MECENESTCVEEDGVAVCVCPPGATGERCELGKHCDLTQKLKLSEEKMANSANRNIKITKF